MRRNVGFGPCRLEAPMMRGSLISPWIRVPTVSGIQGSIQDVELSVLKSGKFWANQIKLITLILMSFVFGSQALRSRQIFDWDGRVTFRSSCCRALGSGKTDSPWPPLLEEWKYKAEFHLISRFSMHFSLCWEALPGFPASCGAMTASEPALKGRKLYSLCGEANKPKQLSQGRWCDPAEEAGSEARCHIPETLMVSSSFSLAAGFGLISWGGMCCFFSFFL